MNDRNLHKNGMGSCDSSLPTCLPNQLPVSTRKIALRDVQNDNRAVKCNHRESTCSIGLGSHLVDVSKVSGVKRPKPECSSSLHCHPLNDQRSKYGYRTLETDQGQTVSCTLALSSVPTASLTMPSPCRPSLPSFLGKPGISFPPAEYNHLGVPSSSEVPNFVSSMESNNRLRKGRFLHLQRLLKQCDESDQSDYVQMLRCLTPVELSRHAVELEKRSICLSFEEGKEIQRTRIMNVLGSP